MNRIIIALAALFASAIFVPAAHAECSDPDDASDVADCVRSIVKVPGMRRVLPPVARPPAVIRGECDADDADDLKECLKGLKVPGVGRLPPSAGRPAAEMPAERKLPDKADAAPAAGTIASTEKPEKSGEPDKGPLCQKYFPNVGRLVLVPCSE